MIKKFIDRLLGKGLGTGTPKTAAVPLGKRVEVGADQHGIDQSLLDERAGLGGGGGGGGGDGGQRQLRRQATAYSLTASDG